MLTILTLSFISRDASVWLLGRMSTEMHFFPVSRCIMKSVKHIEKLMMVNV